MADKRHCFQVDPLVAPYLPPTSKPTETTYACHDRLVSLLAKGVFYEGCVDYCQAQAIGDTKCMLNNHQINRKN